jgi:hypothetical protein
MKIRTSTEVAKIHQRRCAEPNIGDNKYSSCFAAPSMLPIAIFILALIFSDTRYLPPKCQNPILRHLFLLSIAPRPEFPLKKMEPEERFRSPNDTETSNDDISIRSLEAEAGKAEWLSAAATGGRIHRWWLWNGVVEVDGWRQGRFGSRFRFDDGSVGGYDRRVLLGRLSGFGMGCSLVMDVDTCAV